MGEDNALKLAHESDHPGAGDLLFVLRPFRIGELFVRLNKLIQNRSLRWSGPRADLAEWRLERYGIGLLYEMPEKDIRSTGGRIDGPVVDQRISVSLIRAHAPLAV